MASIPHTAGIYQIRCIPSGAVYIGSSVDMAKRWKQHLLDIERGTHHSEHFQFAWNKYGADAFIFEVLEDVVRDRVILLAREQHYLDHIFATLPHSLIFNGSPTANSPLGHKHTEKARQNMRAAHLGKRATEEQRRKQSESHKGRETSPEHRKNLSNALRGRVHSDETRAKISATKTGHPTSDENKRRIQEAQLNSLKTFNRSPDAILCSPGDDVVYTSNVANFCRAYGLARGKISMVLHGHRPHHRGWHLYTPQETIDDGINQRTIERANLADPAGE